MWHYFWHYFIYFILFYIFIKGLLSCACWEGGLHWECESIINRVRPLPWPHFDLIKTNPGIRGWSHVYKHKGTRTHERTYTNTRACACLRDKVFTVQCLEKIGVKWQMTEWQGLYPGCSRALVTRATPSWWHQLTPFLLPWCPPAHSDYFWVSTKQSDMGYLHKLSQHWHIFRETWEISILDLL